MKNKGVNKDFFNRNIIVIYMKYRTKWNIFKNTQINTKQYHNHYA